MRHIYLRQGSVSGEIMVCIVVNDVTFTEINALCQRLTCKFEQIKSIVLNINKTANNVILGEKCVTVWGSDTITDVMCGLTVKLSPLSFYQVNHDMAERVYRLAGELAELKGNEVLLDLYCGAGLIGLSLAKNVKKVVGIEIVSAAVKNAEQNARDNGITNAEFHCGDASLVGELISKKGYEFDIAIVDPPRKGCSSDVIEALANSGVEKIIYVSCNSATLARDINLLKEKGYTAKKVIPADLFPRTVHVETVVLLSQRRPDAHIDIKLDLSELDITAAETKATYQEIKDYVFEKYGLKVSTLYISQIKAKCGIIERENYNKGKEGHRVPKCPKEKEEAIMDALRNFRMI